MASTSESNSKQNRRQVWLYVTIAILLIPLGVGVFWSFRDSDADLIAPLDPSCDLHRGPCQSIFSNGGRVSLSIEPRPISALKSLQIRVQTEGINAKSVDVDFRVVNMNMGYNRPHLKEVAVGKYEGTWVLASCGLDRMVWEATVLIETARFKLAAPFPLVTSRSITQDKM